MVLNVQADTPQSGEAKLARREAARAQANGEVEEDTPGIASLSSSTVITRPAKSSASLAPPEIEEESIPSLVDTELATLQDAIDRADIVLQVVDARDIMGGRSEAVEAMVRDSGGKYGLIVNKIGQLFVYLLRRYVIADLSCRPCSPRSASRMAISSTA
jgi:nuclear GTP-binding protein